MLRPKNKYVRFRLHEIFKIGMVGTCRNVFYFDKSFYMGKMGKLYGRIWKSPKNV